MTDPIKPEQLPRWVPGEITLDSGALGWQGMYLRGYRYGPSDVPVPPMQDYMIVVYGRGVTPMARQCDNRWRNERVVPGDVSLLTHRVHSHWRWSEGIEVNHLYLSPAELARVGSDVFDRDIEDVELFDVLKADDPCLAHMVWNLAAEASGPGVGGRLYADAVMLQTCVHVLRNYANVVFRTRDRAGGLSPRQRRQLLEYMRENLGAAITLADLAAVAGLSLYCLARRFRAEFGMPPHEFLVRERLDAAMRLLRRGDLPLKAVAAQCGFSDQSHMTRVFRRLTGITPGRYRSEQRQAP